MTLPPFVRLRLSPELEDRKLRELEDADAYREFAEWTRDRELEYAPAAVLEHRWPR